MVDHGASPRLPLGDHLRRALGALFLLAAVAVVVLPARAEIEPSGGMLRHPAISAESIAFVYAGDLWVVDREGGLARPLSSPEGPEQRPRFSPDGRLLAFMGNYEGDRDLYVIPVEGGIASRVTYHPSTETLLQWPDDDRLLFASGAQGAPRGNQQLWTVGPEGGLPEKLPVVFGQMGNLSPDGRWLAFTPHSRDHRTWKRYRGGMATDIWLFDLETLESERITDWEGTDTEPMWVGSTVYYVSDQGPEHRWNLWAYDTESGERRQVTRFQDYDVKYPSVGPGPEGKGEIVFQKGSGIHVLDVDSGEVRAVDVRIPGDHPTLRPHRVDVSDNIYNWEISATGKRILLEARGDVWSLPAEHGPAVNHTRSDDAADRLPVWSPDGRWIAWLSDASGEYEIWVQQSDGKEEARQVGDFGPPFKVGLQWAPDSESIAYADKTGTLYIVDVESGRRTEVFADPFGNIDSISWSHDSNWLAYSGTQENLQGALHLYDVENDESHQVTTGMFNDTTPTFDRSGDFLYYLSHRDFSDPVYEDVGTTFVYDGIRVALMVPLREDVELPNPPQEDTESWEEDGDSEDSEDEDSEDGESEEGDSEDADSEDEPEPLVIDLEGFEERALPVGIDSGNLGRLAVNDGGALIFVRFGDDDGNIQIYDPSEDEPEEKTVLAGFRNYALSADGKKLAVRKRKAFAIVDAQADQKFEDPISADGLESSIDPRVEWEQIFSDAWRIMRDYFYDPNMHGVDWKGVREQYAEMLDDCSSRRDLLYVIREMISELNVGHAYNFGGDFQDEPSRPVGMLGVDFSLENGAYRIAAIYSGASWDSDARSVFEKSDAEVSVGDYVLAVNGVAVDTELSPYAAFVGTAGKTTRLTVGPNPRIDDESRDVLVEPLGSESGLRYRHWIEEQRQYVAEKTNGQVGYVYVPDTGVNGQNNLFRQFYGQRDRGALIIDERWNGGGQIPTRFIELLNRPVTNYWALRDGETKRFKWPPDAHHGPKCMLINGLAGSGGDAFPAYFRQAGLGPLIGERTWGGLVGISGGPPLVDGAFLSAPSFAYYEKDGTWGIEGHGVDPDIPVVADPSQLARGTDPQLDRAIEEMLAAIEAQPFDPPPIPDYPDRSGMGIPEEDH